MRTYNVRLMTFHGVITLCVVCRPFEHVREAALRTAREIGLQLMSEVVNWD